MPNTLLQGLPYPSATAAADVPADMQALAVAMESKGVQVYATSGARTSAFAAASLAPAAGMASYVTGTKRLELFDGTQWAHQPGQILSYHKRTSSRVYAGAEVGVVRLNTTSLLGGYRYKIMSSPLVLGPQPNDCAKINIRYTTSGTAGLTDTILGAAEVNVYSTLRAVNTATINFTYAPGANQNFSVLMSLTRSAGAGNSVVVGAADQPIEFWIECAGPDTGDTGVDL